MLRGAVTHCAFGNGGLDLITRFLLRGNDVKLPRLDSNQDNIGLTLNQVKGDRHHPTNYTHRADPLHSMHLEPHGILARADTEDTVQFITILVQPHRMHNFWVTGMSPEVSRVASHDGKPI
jgi:hypothetical protein